MMIADDDRLIRESMSRLIDWEKYGIRIVSVARTGDEALDNILSVHPDILLTDIEMPNLTGIQLLQTLREKKIPCEVIFLSAYNNFAYAQEAVRYGAFHYLLKPVDEIQLIDAVTRCRNQIMLRRKEQQAQRQDRQIQNAAYINGLRSLMLYSGPDYGENPDIEFMRFLGFHQDASYCMAAICVGTEQSIVPQQITFPETSEIYRRELVALSEKELMLVFIVPAGSFKILQRHIQECAFSLSEKLIPVDYICISDIHTCDEIWKIYPECSFAILFTKLYQKKKICFFTDALHGFHTAEPLPEFSFLLETLCRRQMPISSVLESLFRFFAENGMLYSISDMQLYCLSLLDSFGESRNPFSCSASDWEDNFMFSFKKRLLSCSRVTELCEALRQILHQLFERPFQEKIPKSGLIKKALNYIDENYPNATLADASGRLFISSSYLSRLFAAEMGESFSRYLMRYRVEIAKKQLCNPKNRLYEIAEAVGYSDLSHFSKAFKLIEGVSPGRYREENWKKI